MKRKLIGVAVLVAMILGCMTGCGEKEVTPDNVEDVINSMSDEELESAIIDGANKLDEESSAADEEETTEAPTEVVYEPSQDIIDADFSSLLIQLNNDVFQQGGYMTVAELVEQYGDRYEFTYKDGTYEERKDYLVEYNVGTRYTVGTQKWFEIYQIDMTPLYGDGRYGVTAYIANLTSPDEKVTLDQTYVLYFTESWVNKKYYTPVWTPNGFYANAEAEVLIYNGKDELSSENGNYSASNIESFLESKGFTYIEGMNSAYAEANMKYTHSDIMGEVFTAYFTGEPNISGLKPLFKCSFSLNDDTDKLASVGYYFVDLVE